MDSIDDLADCRQIENSPEFCRFKLHQFSLYLEELKNKVSIEPQPMITAAMYCLKYALDSTKMANIQPFIPLVKTNGYTGKCRRQQKIAARQ